jgi:uncharacterized protein (TIGR03435 family)
MTIHGIGLLVLASGVVFGQAPARPTPAGRAEFEVASIKPSAPAGTGTNRVLGGMHLDGSQVNWTFLSLNDYLGTAYGVRHYQISAPDWMASARFDINAKLPAGAAGKDIQGMLRTLLEDRFQMKTHRESKELPVYGLVVGKGGLKMQESPPDSGEAQNGAGKEGVNVAAVGRQGGVTVNYGNGIYFTFADNRFEGKKLPASLMADVMARFTDRPVIDMTNLKGNYDFLIELSPEDFLAMGIRAAIAAGVALPPQALQMAEAASGDSLLNALEKLGLKLESRKAPVEVLVVDHCEKAPTEN